MREFRLYYDGHGNIICYTCDKLPGDNYLVIDSETYAASNPFVKVIDGKIIYQNQITVISKLEQSESGVKCVSDDVCVVSNTESYTCWEMKTYEYRTC